MIFSTTETGMPPRAWWTLPSTSACACSSGLASATTNSTTQHLAAYPDADAATKAIAEAHGVTADCGLAHRRRCRGFHSARPHLASQKDLLIIHPQFTEPEAALLVAGHQPDRLILSPAAGFRLDAYQIPAEPDLILIGNPTNPTSVLHPALLINSPTPGRPHRRR